MKNRLVLLVAAAAFMLVGAVNHAGADVITAAYWSFNDAPFTGNPSTVNLSANIGIGSLVTGGIDGGTNHDLPAGTTLNALTDVSAGTALGMRRGERWNNGWWQLVFDASEWANLELSFAALHTTGGATTYQASYSTNGGSSFTNLGTPVTVTTSWAVYTLDLGVLDGIEDAVVRFTLSGATAGIGTTGARFAIDNVHLTTIPEPASAGLLGLAALALLGRRRAC